MSWQKATHLLSCFFSEFVQNNFTIGLAVFCKALKVLIQSTKNRYFCVTQKGKEKLRQSKQSLHWRGVLEKTLATATVTNVIWTALSIGVQGTMDYTCLGSLEVRRKKINSNCCRAVHGNKVKTMPVTVTDIFAYDTSPTKMSLNIQN